MVPLMTKRAKCSIALTSYRLYRGGEYSRLKLLARRPSTFHML